MFACCFVFNVYQYCSQAIPYLSKYPLVPSTNMDIIERAIWVVYVKLIQFFFYLKQTKNNPLIAMNGPNSTTLSLTVISQGSCMFTNPHMGGRG